MTTLTVEVVRDSDAVMMLGAEWEALWRRTTTRGPFQSPAWLLAWWRVFGNGRPVVAILRDGERLVGLLPAYVLDGRLLLMGAGISDYLDALVDPDAPTDAGTRLLGAALDASGVGACDLFDLPPDSMLRDIAVPAGWTAISGDGEPCPHLPLGAGPDALRAAIGAGTHRKVRMNRHRAMRRGGWTTGLADPVTLPAMQDALIALHGLRWTTRGQAGVLADADVLRFHREMAPGLLAAGVLRLQVLRIGDSVAAACMALLAPGRILFYLSGFDAAFAFESPGTILLAEMLEAAIVEGRTEADFLRGQEGYKYAWGAVDRLSATRLFSRA